MVSLLFLPTTTMPKLQELFVRPDKTKILDTKLLMTVVDMPSAPVIETSEDGTKQYENFYVKLSHQGQTYDLKLNPDQMARIFTHKKKTGEVFWQAKAGDSIYFWYASNQKMPSRPYFAAEPVREGDTVANALAVFGEDGEMTPVMAPAATPKKPTFAKSNAGGYRRAEETKWDGTPRQSGFRQARAGLLQAILSNPNVDPFSDKHVEMAGKLADRLVAENRVAAKALEENITD